MTDYLAPITPRGKDGLLEGDRLPEMPHPEDLKFVVVGMATNSMDGVVLRPIPSIPHAVFHSREDARLVAESQVKNYAHKTTHGIAFAVFGPYSSSVEVSQSPWNLPRSTPCDTYEYVNVTVRREYFPRGHPKQGQVKQEVQEKVLNHVDFGFNTPSKNTLETQAALNVSGSRLTSYLSPDGNLISPNVHLLTNHKNAFANDDEYISIMKHIKTNQLNAIDILIDDIFRVSLHKLAPKQSFSDQVIPFQILGSESHVLFEGQQPVPAGKLPREFAKILRTAVNSFYGKSTEIKLNFSGDVLSFPLSVDHE